MIYVIQERDELGVFSSYVKVGFCHGDGIEHVKARLNKHQTGNPRTLVVVGMCDGGRDMESELLDRFKQYRVKRKGVREWFLLTGALAEWVETVRCESIQTYVRGKQKEREERERKNRCSNCGEKTHFVNRCPALAQRREDALVAIKWDQFCREWTWVARSFASPRMARRFEAMARRLDDRIKRNPNRKAWWPVGAAHREIESPPKTFEWRGKLRAG